MKITNPSNEKFDIIILAGQSNAESSGLGPTDTPWEQREDILMFKNDFAFEIAETPYGMQFMKVDPKEECYIEVAKERSTEEGVRGVLALQFAKKYAENNLEKDRKILIVHTPVGGTGFAGKQWGLGEVLYERMTEMSKLALGMNKENRVVAFLWHQGEHDAYEEADLPLDEKYKKHCKNLTTLIDGVRENFGKDLPFITAGFTKAWTENEYKDKNLAILKAISDTCEKVGNAGVCYTDDLKNNHDVVGNDDIVHFNRQAVDVLGRRYYDEFAKIINK